MCHNIINYKDSWLKMISLRKINTLLVILITIFLLNHAVLAVLGMSGLTDYTPDITITGRRLFYPLAAHIIISSYLFISDKIKQNKTYPELISETTQQILTGISIMLFAALHIINHMNTMLNSNAYIHFTVDVLLFISIALHLRVSLPRFLISLGLLQGKNSYNDFKRKNNIIISAILILCIISEIIFYTGGFR